MKRIACILLLAFTTLAAHAQSVGTAFTIQGRLHDEAGPSPGPVDLRLTPWDAASDGTAMELPVELTGVPLRDGVFSVDVDFGPLPFLGEPVWIAVEVRGPGDADYVPLEPRQRVAPTPYAIHAGSVGVDAVDGFAIRDGAVDAAKIAPGAVGASAIDPSQVQRRIGPDCAAGEAIAGIAEDGTTTCAATGDEDWYIWSDGSAVTARKKVSIGTDGTRGAQLLVMRNSGISTPHVELVELEDDYARLSMANPGPPGSDHFGYWTIAARTFSSDDGGPGTDRINFFNNRSGDVMSLLGDGRLGIGVFDPLAALDVDGSVRVRSLAHADASARTVRVEPDGDLVASAAPVRYYNVGPWDLDPERDTTPYNRIGGFIYVASAATDGYLGAHVHLPDGAILTELQVRYFDNAVDTDLTVRLGRDPHASGSTFPLASFTSSGSSLDGQTATIAIPNHVVDNSGNHYTVIVSREPEWAGSNLRIYNLRIAYIAP